MEFFVGNFLENFLEFVKIFRTMMMNSWASDATAVVHLVGLLWLTNFKNAVTFCLRIVKSHYRTFKQKRC